MSTGFESLSIRRPGLWLTRCLQAAVCWVCCIRLVTGGDTTTSFTGKAQERHPGNPLSPLPPRGLLGCTGTLRACLPLDSCRGEAQPGPGSTEGPTPTLWASRHLMYKPGSESSEDKRKTLQSPPHTHAHAHAHAHAYAHAHAHGHCCPLTCGSRGGGSREVPLPIPRPSSGVSGSDLLCHRCCWGGRGRGDLAALS